VHLFSPWRFNIDDAAKSFLHATGWQKPSSDAMPTGRELNDAYLEPLSRTWQITAVLETGARVRAVSQRGIDKIVSRDRTSHPFIGDRKRAGKRADRSRPRRHRCIRHLAQSKPTRRRGRASSRRVGVAERLSYGLPDGLGKEREIWAGERVLVVGRRSFRRQRVA
jgi:hypothetical protein